MNKRLNQYKQFKQSKQSKAVSQYFAYSCFDVAHKKSHSNSYILHLN